MHDLNLTLQQKQGCQVSPGCGRRWGEKLTGPGWEISGNLGLEPGEDRDPKVVQYHSA